MENALRILLVTWDGAGNLPPELSLVRALVERGHDVHVMSHDSTQERFEETGATFHGYSNIIQYNSTIGMPGEHEATFALENIFYCKDFMSELHSVNEKFSPDVIIVDIALNFATLEANRIGKPMVVLGHTMYSLSTRGGAYSIQTHFQALNDTAIEFGLKPFKSRKELVESADLVLVFSYAQFDREYENGFSQNVLQVGPLRSSDAEPFEWERSYPERKLAVVALSTSNQKQQELLQRLCDALGGIEVEALVTTGFSIAPDSLSTKDNIKAIRYIPHDSVLPNADLLVTHAGHGTIMAGITYGTPILCVPMGRDQPNNASRVVELGIGDEIETDATLETIRRAAVGILNDKEILKRAEWFSHSIKDDPGVDEAVYAIESLIGERVA